MGRLTLMVIPEDAKQVKKIMISGFLVKSSAFVAILISFALGFVAFEYKELSAIRNDYKKIRSENSLLKGEAKLLVSNLDGVKETLRQIQDYTTKLDDLVSFKVKNFSKKTGIGPLSPEEYSKAIFNQAEISNPSMGIPLGIKIDSLVFRPALESLSNIGKQANKQTIELQKLLSTLGQKKSLLDSIPTVKPVDGWVTSKYGKRISPFTGKSSMHKGIDVASGIGTPIYAPANGVVIFSGTKDGFGNFIMIAHGHGVVSRYGHNSQNMVVAGQKVKRGDQIGAVGMSGRSTGPHLHYEVWVNGRPANPKQFILHKF